MLFRSGVVAGPGLHVARRTRAEDAKRERDGLELAGGRQTGGAGDLEAGNHSSSEWCGDVGSGLEHTALVDASVDQPLRRSTAPRGVARTATDITIDATGWFK